MFYQSYKFSYNGIDTLQFQSETHYCQSHFFPVPHRNLVSNLTVLLGHTAVYVDKMTDQ
jgi:hypothetical protein